MDRRLSFGEHLQIAIAKAIQCGASLARLMPNIGGRRGAKRRLLESVVYSKLLYAVVVSVKQILNLYSFSYDPDSRLESDIFNNKKQNGVYLKFFHDFCNFNCL